MPDCFYYLDGIRHDIKASKNFPPSVRISDTGEIIDLKRNIKIPYWYVIRPLRCGIPFTNINGKPIYDAGAVANVPVNSIFLRYEPQEFVFIHATPNTQYDTYPEISYWDLLFNSLSNVMAAANNSLQSMIIVR